MDSIGKLADETFYVFDSNGYRKVVGGKEYPMTEEEYRRDNPYHKDTGCTECSFVQDKETLLTFLVPREVKERATSDPEFVGKFTLPGMTGHFNFFVFRCPFCDNVEVANISSIRRLWCSHCRDYYRLDPVRHRHIITKDRDISDEVLKYHEDKSKKEKPWGFNKWNIGLAILALWTLVIFFLREFRILG